jgi:DNA modification methylase
VKAQTVNVWHSCYEGGWNGVITPESFSHPAKFSRALINRIYGYCAFRGYLKRGDLVGDCFGGIGTGGIIAAYAGLRWVGCELEPRFVGMAQDNFRLHADHWTRLGLQAPTIVQGDSRQFDEVVGQVAGVVCSPPFTQTPGGAKGINVEGYAGKDGRSDDKVGDRTYQELGGDRSKGNIETLKEGSLTAVVTSPPYADGLGHDSGHPRLDAVEDDRRASEGCARRSGYHSTPGQIGSLREGKLDAVVTSPPWEKNCEGVMKASKFKDPAAFAEQQRHSGHGASLKAKMKAMAADEHRADYGQSQGQIGKDSGKTYWAAMSLVYSACHRAIRPGGVIVVVVKDYVKQKQRVPLCDDTATLLEHCGFTVVERIHAMLVKETHHNDLFEGVTTIKTERKSFFRRLAEKKGSPPIDFEEVIIARKEP